MEFAALAGAVLIAAVLCAMVGYSLGRADVGGMVEEPNRAEETRLRMVLEEQRRKLQAVVDRLFGPKDHLGFDPLLVVLEAEFGRINAELSRKHGALQAEKVRAAAAEERIAEADRRRQRAEARVHELQFAAQADGLNRRDLAHRLRCVRVVANRLRGLRSLDTAEILQVSNELLCATDGPRVARLAYFGELVREALAEAPPAFGPRCTGCLDDAGCNFPRCGVEVARG